MVILIAFSAIAVIVLVLILFLVQFYRNPERKIPEEENSIVSPADGKVIKIMRVNTKYVHIDKGMLGKVQMLARDIAKECVVISIFMSPFDVHYNRAPIAGKVKKVSHVGGKLLPVNTFENGLQNEHTEIIIQNRNIRVKVLQIAGFLARRIRCFVKTNQKMEKGERIGMICLGSQATLIMPSKVNVVVKVGERVKAGSSIIAELP